MQAGSIIAVPTPVGSASRHRIRCITGEHCHELEIKTALRPAEREAVFRLRHKAFCGEGKDLAPSDDGQERDAYDDNAVLVMASLEGVLVGVIRVIFPLQGRLLLETLGFTLPAWMPTAKTAEISRLVCDKQALARCAYSPEVSVALYQKAFLESRRRGQRYWVFDTGPDVLRTMRRLRWNLHSLGPALIHHGRRFEPFWISLQESQLGWVLHEDGNARSQKAVPCWESA